MKPKESLILVLLGAPGSGKGTLAELISQKYLYAHISTGDLFRKEIHKKGLLAKELFNYLSQGALVPDELVLKTIISVLSSNDYPNGYILDGFPRTLPQAESLNHFLNQQHKKYLAINLIISQETVIKRLSSRLTCNVCKKIFQKQYNLGEKPLCPSCHKGTLFPRDDDKPEIIAKRLAVYQKQTQPIETFYRNLGILKNVFAERSLQEIFDDVKKILSFNEKH